MTAALSPVSYSISGFTRGGTRRVSKTPLSPRRDKSNRAATFDTLICLSGCHPTAGLIRIDAPALAKFDICLDSYIADMVYF